MEEIKPFPHWNSVEVKPEKEGNYIVAFQGGHRKKRLVIPSQWAEGRWHTLIAPECIVYWMCLPEFPSEES